MSGLTKQAIGVDEAGLFLTSGKNTTNNVALSPPARWPCVARTPPRAACAPAELVLLMTQIKHLMSLL